MYYHVTAKTSLPSILKLGLEPRIGERSLRLGETEKAVYCFRDKASVEDALMGWMADVFDEDEELVILELDFDAGKVAESAGFELAILETIPPSAIKALYDEEWNKRRVVDGEIEGWVNHEVFACKTLEFAHEMGFNSSITPRGNLLVFHGTSKRNANSILASGNFRDYPFFALEQEVAERFARQAGKDPVVIAIEVDPGAVIPTNGYLSARMEGLVRGDDSVFRLLPQPFLECGELAARKKRAPYFQR